MKVRIALVAGLAGACAAATYACVGDDGGTNVNLQVAEGGSGDDGNGSSNTSGDDGGTGGDGTSPTDGGSATCSTACNDTLSLHRCLADGAAETVQCTYDCTADGGGAHCRVFTPYPPVAVTDVSETASLGAIDFIANGYVDTDTGEIQGLRMGNQSASAHEVISKIAFHTMNGVGIFTMKSLTIEPSTTMTVRGKNALAIVTDTIAVKGVIDVRGWDVNGNLCASNTPGPGGYAGGDGTSAGLGPGGGAAALNVANNTNGAGGGGGGGYGGNGGNAGDFGGGNGAGAKGGATYAFSAPIHGGSGGGSAPSGNVMGGGGGGAIQLVAATSIAIGGTGVAGGINAGGCHGPNGSTTSGGGGGSGGTIVFESPLVSLLMNGVVAANGGGGGSGPPNLPSQSSQDGQFGLSAAQPTSAVGFGQGGGGSVGSPAVNLNDSYNGSDGLISAQKSGGAGGGAAGRIIIRNLSGTFSLPNGATMSPTPPGGPVMPIAIDRE